MNTTVDASTTTTIALGADPLFMIAAILLMVFTLFEIGRILLVMVLKYIVRKIKENREVRHEK